MTGGANNPVARNRVNAGAHVTRTLNMDTPNMPIDTAPNLDTPDYYNVKDDMGSPTYYNTTPEEDHPYIELVENPYNKLPFSGGDQDSSYTALS